MSNHRRSAWYRFWRDERGAGTVFMICLLPMFLGLAGLAIDAATAYRARAILQAATDAASLAATLKLPDTKAATDAAKSYAIRNVPDFGNVLAESDVEPGYWDETKHTFIQGGSDPANAVRVTLKMTAANNNALPTTFLRLIGIDHWDISTQAVATANQPNLWVALVLDNTGSMTQYDKTGSKIAALKTATHALLGMLQGASTRPGDVQVAIVPFVKDVNVGNTAYTAPWIDWSDWNTKNGTCTVAGRNDQPTCEAVGTWTAAQCSDARYTTQSTCQNHHATWKAASCSISGRTTQSACTAKGVWSPSKHSTWNGCIMDRGNAAGPDVANDFDVMNTPPTAGTASSFFPAEQYSSCPQLLSGLSYNWTALNGEVDSMQANGTTNQTIGLVWGWHALSQGYPLSAPVPPKGTKRIIILLSDGYNTQNRWSGDGSNHASAVDARMALACANAATDGIKFYTVFVDIAGAQGNSAVLQNCATEKYYDLTSSGDITKAFADIGHQIIKMRLVR